MDQLDKHKEKNQTVVIAEKNRPIWQLIIASILYTLLFYILVKFSIIFYRSEFSLERTMFSLYALISLLLVFVFAFVFSVKVIYIFDFENKKFKEILKVAFIEYGEWEALPKLEYVAVFDNKKTYEVNLWYVKNKFFQIAIYNNKEAAFLQAKIIAKTLKVRLLDASERDEKNKWIL